MPKKRKKVKLPKLSIKKIGHSVFALGLVLVLVFALLDPTKLSVGKAVLLLVLGLIVGLIDVPKKEVNSFILASIAIIVISVANFELIAYKFPTVPYTIGHYIKGILMNASIFFSLAMLTLALKIIFRVYKE